MEDVDLMARIRSRGDKIVVMPRKVSTSARRWQKEGILTCRLRNWVIRALYTFGASPGRLVKFYRKD